jgi:predicted CoA-binding protein
VGPGSSLACDIGLNTALTPAQRRRYQDVTTIRRLLAETRTIAIVGLSSEPQKASHFVGSYLKHVGYRIVPVNPRGGRILDETVYPDLSAIPEAVDVVVVFRPPIEALGFAKQAVAIGARALWLQLRIVSVEAAELALGAELAVVMDKCIKMEHGRFAGTLHWGGMNTEIVSARKARLVR